MITCKGIKPTSSFAIFRQSWPFEVRIGNQFSYAHIIYYITRYYIMYKPHWNMRIGKAIRHPTWIKKMKIRQSQFWLIGGKSTFQFPDLFLQGQVARLSPNLAARGFIPGLHTAKQSTNPLCCHRVPNKNSGSKTVIELQFKEADLKTRCFSGKKNS